MFNSKLGSHKLIYGAEMDGVVSKEPINSTCAIIVLNKYFFNLFFYRGGARLDANKFC